MSVYRRTSINVILSNLFGRESFNNARGDGVDCTCCVLRLRNIVAPTIARGEFLSISAMNLMKFGFSFYVECLILPFLLYTWQPLPLLGRCNVECTTCNKFTISSGTHVSELQPRPRFTVSIHFSCYCEL